MRPKKPRRRVSCKRRVERLEATGPNEGWSMDFMLVDLFETRFRSEPHQGHSSARKSSIAALALFVALRRLQHPLSLNERRTLVGSRSDGQDLQ